MNDRTYNSGAARLRSPERMERLEVSRTVDLTLENAAAKSVLDVGTGSALFASEFSGRGLTAAGVDINPEMLEAAKEYLPQAEFKLAPAEQLPFPDKSFDLVFMGLVFHEVDDFEKALGEAKRTARKMTAILEWPCEVQEFGPPVEDRLKEEFVKDLALKTGFAKFECHRLKNLVLYKLYV